MEIVSLYFRNNINGIGNIKDWKEVLSLRHPEIACCSGKDGKENYL